jgi:energy-coupling factor transporter ATP-binding protein EcfA2
MFITKLVLHRCKRFYVKGIETFEINPTMKTQIVLGTNGSGKSSLLKIGFTVLPAEKSDFETGGYKLVHVLHHGKSYVLRTDISGKSPTHSFICDGEEYNEGHTGAVQKELVREHFGMTSELHDVLSGQLVFTKMSSLERRQWITLLSSADFDYVIKLHGRIKRAARDTGAVIKHQSGRLVQESAKKIDDATFNTLRRQSQEITEKLIRLHQHSKRDGIADNFDYYSRQYTQLSSDVEALLARAKYLRVSIPTAVKSTQDDDVIQLKESLRSRAQMLEAALHEVSERHQEIDRQLHNIAELEEIDPAVLQTRLTEIKVEQERLRGRFKTAAEVDRLPNHQYCFAVVQETMETLHGVNTVDASYLDRNTIQAKQRELSELQEKMMAGTSKIGELEYRLDHIHNSSVIQCPACHHQFKEGISGDEEGNIKELLEKGTRFRQSMEQRIRTVRDWLQEAHQAGDVIHTLQRLRDHNPDLVELWKLIQNAGGFGRGRELVQLCTDFISDVKTKLALNELEHEAAPLVERLNALKQLDQSSGLRDVAHSLSERVVDLKSHLLDTRTTLREVEQFYDRMVEAREIGVTVERSLERLNDLMDQMVKFIAVEEIAAQVKRHQVQLGMLEQSLAEAEVQMGIVNDLNRSLEQAKAEEKALITLEKILSPKDGIIAEQIMVFINTFISSINDVIAKVWGYNLALDTCNIEEGELDYKFPMYVHTADNIIPDIAFGSDSQVDIVNQAFRLVVYKFLNLEGYPLYLDELGRTFDEVHRLNLTLAVKDLMEDEIYSQVFFISHSFESQNSFPSSQIAVIDDSHVTLKRAYNEHVTIT